MNLIRDLEHGTPRGTFEMTEEHETGCDRVGELGNNEDMDDVAIDQLWQHMQKRNRVTPCLKQPKDASKGIETITIKGGGATNDDSEDIDADLDEIWGIRFHHKEPDGDDSKSADEEAKPQKRRTTKGKPDQKKYGSSRWHCPVAECSDTA